ncbi:MAG: D-alanyl-D-alanine carboxypeptidase [Lachnospiraceae bacterium]|nr:D-alanyl-D-alanine carboxypeptidase [Lachnospiraceae bacterium]
MNITINKIKHATLLLLIIFISFQTGCVNLKNKYQSSRLLSNLYTANESTFAEGVAKRIVVPDISNELTVDNIGADCYFIASTDRLSTSFNKHHNSFRRVPMASLTKLMTALIVLKNCDDLQKEYYVTADAVDLDKDVSKANLKAGDKVKVIDLLYGLLIPSGNDAAICLAENLVDNYDNFIVMMNNEAERLGALNTHFANPHGLDSEYHFSSAYDLFLITKELSKYKEFGEITKLKTYTANIVESNGTIRTEKWVNTNYFITEELLISGNVDMLAGKTGNTKSAGNCLILLTKDKKTGLQYISVVLNAKSKRNSYYNSNALLSAIVR